jgi:allantoicase
LKVPAAASFTGLVDLAAASFGGRALGASDDFFAGVENLIQPGRGVFIPDKFTEYGKWMDGWESRRKRGAGYDFCILELGALGQVLAFDVDTHHFVGNHPPFASIDGVVADKDTPFAELARLPWRELLPQTPLLPDAQNLFVAASTGPVTHLRLNIFPDGGVARLRAFGRVHPTWQPAALDSETKKHVAPNAIDLAALANGALALACSDAHFGPMNNLLLPGRSPHMGGGWETRRKRAPGHDWILIKLGTRGTVQALEVDTQHFKGNFPDRCSVEVIDAPAARITDLVQSAAWSALLPKTKLYADTRHFFGSELLEHSAASHLRLNIYPDGGVSRLRAWGSADV